MVTLQMQAVTVNELTTYRATLIWKQKIIKNNMHTVMDKIPRILAEQLEICPITAVWHG